MRYVVFKKELKNQLISITFFINMYLQSLAFLKIW